jgi:hypothetical protein
MFLFGSLVFTNNFFVAVDTDVTEDIVVFLYLIDSIYGKDILPLVNLYIFNKNMFV